MLVDGAVMPGSDELPPELSILALTNALAIDSARFSEDMDRLLPVADPESGLRKNMTRISPRRRRVGQTISMLGVGQVVTKGTSDGSYAP